MHRKNTKSAKKKKKQEKNLQSVSSSSSSSLALIAFLRTRLREFIYLFTYIEFWVLFRDVCVVVCKRARLLLLAHVNTLRLR